jgi:hypothetical protein
MRKTIISVLLLACGAAQAAPQWIPVGNTINGKMVAFVDIGSIRISGEIRRAWFKYVYAPRSQKDEHENQPDKVSFNQEAFNCADETSRIEAVNAHYEGGTGPGEPSALLPTSWTPIGPQTLRDMERRFICTRVPKCDTASMIGRMTVEWQQSLLEVQ